MTTLANGGTLAHSNFLLSPQVQADFYAKLARLEKEVLTGRHPQYKFHQTDVEKLVLSRNQAPQKLNLQAATASFRKVTPIKTNGHPIPPSTTTHQTVQARPPPLQPLIPVGPRQSLVAKPKPLPKVVPKIDPVLLTKSENLVQAEQRLQRQRTEDQARELQFKRERIEDSLKKLAVARKEQRPDQELDAFCGPNTLDVAEALKQAHALVKPIRGRHHEDVLDAQSASSFSDGYYSSRGNSWLSDSNVPVTATASADQNLTSKPAKTVALTREAAIETIAEKPQAGEVNRLKAPAVLPPKPAPAPLHIETEVADGSGRATTTSPKPPGPREESYSPPAADAFDGSISTRLPIPVLNDAPRPSNFMMTPANIPAVVGRARESESYSPPPVEADLATSVSTTRTKKGKKKVLGEAQPKPVSKAERKRLKKFQQQEIEANRLSKAARKQARQQITQVQQAQKAQKAQQAQQDSSPREQNRKRKRVQEQVEEESDAAHWRPLHLRQPAEPVSPEEPVKNEPQSPVSLRNDPAAQAPRRLVLRPDGRAEIEVLSTSDRSATVNSRTRPYVDGITYSAINPQPSMRTVAEPIYVHDSDGPPPPTRRRVEHIHAEERHFSRASTSRTRHGIPLLEHGNASALISAEDDPPIRRQSFMQGEVVRHRASSRAVDTHDPEVYAKNEGRMVLRESVPPPMPRRVFTDDYGSEFVVIPAENVAPPPKPRRFVDEDGNEFIAIPTKPIRQRRFMDEDGNEFIAFPAEPSPRSAIHRVPQIYSDEVLSYAQETYQPVGRVQMSRNASYVHGDESVRRSQSVLTERAPIIARAPSRALEQLGTYRAPAHVVDLTDDDADYRRMPPPPAPVRLGVRKRPIEAVDDVELGPLPYKTGRRASQQPVPMPPRMQMQSSPVRAVSGPIWLDGSGEYEPPGRSYAVRQAQQPTYAVRRQSYLREI